MRGVHPLLKAPGLAKIPGVEVDAEGLPWDKRIHSESKGVLKSGHWKTRRNTDPATVSQVRAELLAAANAPMPGAIPVGTGAPPPSPGQALPGQVPPPPAAQPPAAAVATGAPVFQVEGSAPATPDAGAYAAATFPDLMSRVVDLTMSGVTPDQINALCAQMGIHQPRDFYHRPDLIPRLMASLATLGA